MTTDEKLIVLEKMINQLREIVFKVIAEKPEGMSEEKYQKTIKDISQQCVTLEWAYDYIMTREESRNDPISEQCLAVLLSKNSNTH